MDTLLPKNMLQLEAQLLADTPQLEQLADTLPLLPEMLEDTLLDTPQVQSEDMPSTINLTMFSKK